MSRTATRWLPLSVVGALVALVGGLVVISGALASPAAVAVGSATVAPGADATVNLTVTPAGSEQVGALTVDITYESGITAKSCTNKAAAAAACNTAYVEGSKVRYTLAGTTAVSGTLAELVFGTTAAGEFDLTVSVVTCADIEGTTIGSCPATNGKITVQVPTPSPSPSPSPTAAPTATPTPKKLPATGGTPSDGSGSSMAWVLGTLGLAVLAGGVWAVSRTRRETL